VHIAGDSRVVDPGVGLQVLRELFQFLWVAEVIGATALSLAVPNLVESLRQIDAELLNEPAQILAAVVRSVGSRLYNDVAERYILVYARKALVLPWEQFRYLIFSDKWPTDDDYIDVAYECDDGLRKARYIGLGGPVTIPPRSGRHGEWPFFIKDAIQRNFGRTGSLFFNPEEGVPTFWFWSGLNLSVRVLAQLIVRIDTLNAWTASHLDKIDPADKDDGAATVPAIETLVEPVNVDIQDIEISWTDPM
jgi:hypothetical protein